MAPKNPKVADIIINKMQLYVKKKSKLYKAIPIKNAPTAPKIAAPILSILIKMKPKKTPIIVDMKK